MSKKEAKLTTIDFSLEKGDVVYSPSWSMGPVEIVNVNWALRAAAVLLNPRGGLNSVVVWPVDRLSREDVREAQQPPVPPVPPALRSSPFPQACSMKSISRSKSVRAPAKSVTAKSGAGTKTCVCKKRLQYLSPGHTQSGKPCYYCAACIPF